MILKPEDPQAVLDELCRRYSPAILRKARPLLNGEASLQWNWYLDALCHQLDLVASGEITRLIPPRYSKS